MITLVHMAGSGTRNFCLTSALIPTLMSVAQASRALKVYQEAVGGGYVPRLHVLDRVLGCLRTPRPAAAGHSDGALPFHEARRYSSCKAYVSAQSHAP